MAYEYGGKSFANRGDAWRAKVSTSADENDVRRMYGTNDPGLIKGIETQNAIKELQRKREEEYVYGLAEAKAKTDELKRQNILGLGTMPAMLNDRDSALYQNTYGPNNQTAEELGAGVEMSVGGIDGSAPTPLPASPLAGLRISRTIRPENADAHKAQASSVVRSTPYDNPLRQRETNIKEVEVLTKALSDMDEDSPAYAAMQKRLSELTSIPAPTPVPPVTAAPLPRLRTSGTARVSVGPVGGGAAPAIAAAPVAPTGEVEMSIDPLLGQLSPDDRIKVENELKAWPNITPAQVINALKRKGEING